MEILRKIKGLRHFLKKPTSKRIKVNYFKLLAALVMMFLWGLPPPSKACSDQITDIDALTYVRATEKLVKLVKEDRLTGLNLQKEAEFVEKQILSQVKDEKERELLHAMIATHLSISGQNLLVPSLERVSLLRLTTGLNTFTLDATDSASLKAQGINDAAIEAFIREKVELYRPYFQSLVVNGAKFTDEGWDLSGFNFDQIMRDESAVLPKNPSLLTAIGYFLSPEFAKQMSSSQRRIAVITPQWAYLPPKKNQKGEWVVPHYAVAEWKREVRAKGEAFDSTFKEFIALSKKASGIWNRNSGTARFSVLGLYTFNLGQRSSDEGPTSTLADDDKDDAYLRLHKIVASMKELGVNPETVKGFLEAIRDGLKYETKNLEAVIHYTWMAQFAVVISPAAMYLGVILAPYAVGAVAGTAGITGTTLVALKTSASIAAGVGALLPFVAGGAIALNNAFSKSHFFGDNVACNLYEEWIKIAPGTALMAALSADLPLIGSGIGFAGSAAGLSAYGTYVTTQFIAGAGFLASMGYTAGQGLFQCNQAIKNLSTAHLVSDEKGYKNYANEAWQVCIRAGIDAGLAIGGAVNSGFHFIKARKLKATNDANRAEVELNAVRTLAQSENETSTVMFTIRSELAAKYDPGSPEILRLTELHRQYQTSQYQPVHAVAFLAALEALGFQSQSMSVLRNLIIPPAPVAAASPKPEPTSSQPANATAEPNPKTTASSTEMPSSPAKPNQTSEKPVAVSQEKPAPAPTPKKSLPLEVASIPEIKKNLIQKQYPAKDVEILGAKMESLHKQDSLRYPLDTMFELVENLPSLAGAKRKPALDVAQAAIELYGHRLNPKGVLESIETSDAKVLAGLANFLRRAKLHYDVMDVPDLQKAHRMALRDAAKVSGRDFNDYIKEMENCLRRHIS